MSLLHFSRVLSGVEESLSLPIAPTLSAARLNDTTVRYSWTGGSGIASLTAYYRAPSGSGSYSSASVTGQSSYDVTVSSGGNCDLYLSAANGAGTVNSSVVTGSAASGGVPSYTPLKLASFDSLTTGSTSPASVDGFDSPQTVGAVPTVSTAIAGPFGGGNVCRVNWDSRNRYIFGGDIWDGSQPVSDGSEMWVRWYVYLVPTFQWTFGDNGNGDGWGATKWLRQFFGNAQDNCFQMENTGKCWGMTTEGYSGAGANMEFASKPAALPQGQWVCQEFYIRFHNTSAQGRIRYWQDGVLGAEMTGLTKAPGAQTVQRILLGDYWNGGSPQAQTMYFDEVIISFQTPDATDSGGRAMIGTTRRVGDFA